MTVKLLTEPYLEFLSLKGGCTCSSVFFHVKMPHCWKSYVEAQIPLSLKIDFFLANSAEPEEMPHLGSRCLPKYPFRGLQLVKG